MGEAAIETVVQRLVNNDVTTTEKISTLERKFDEMVKSLEEYRAQNAELTRTDMETMSQTLTEQINSVRDLTSSHYEVTNKKHDQMKREMEENMHHVFEKLETISQRLDVSVNVLSLKEPKREEQSGEPNREGTRPTPINIPTTPFSRRPCETTAYITESEPRRPTMVPQPVSLNSIRHSIIIPPASAAPAFYGRHNESPTQFLIRVEEYADSVHAWDHETLLKGISQFLRDSALEWYCQLRFSSNRPTTWFEFKDAFLAQFNSSVRKARQEQEWHECKQKENETINEFLVRLRALWREQKPKETEADLVKHLFCRMRNDLLNMLGVSRGVSLEEVISEVQLIEDILYRRATRERIAKQIKQASSSNAVISSNKRYKEDYMRRTTPWSSKQDSANNYTRKTQVHRMKEETPRRYTNNRYQITTEQNFTQPMNSFERYSCDLFRDDTSYYRKYYDDNCAHQHKPPRNTNLEYSSNDKRVPFQRAKHSIQNRGEYNKPVQQSNHNVQSTTNATSSDQKLESISAPVEERNLDSFWPDGTESWHIHEIKPQREVFKQSFYSDSTEVLKRSTIESQSKTLKKIFDPHTNSLLDKTICQFDETIDPRSQRMSEPSIDQFKPPSKSRQNTAKSLPNVSLVVVVKFNERQRRYRPIPEMAHRQLKVKVQRKLVQRSRKPIENDLSTISKSFGQSSFHYKPHNRLLPFILTCLIQLSLFIFSALLRIRIAHNIIESSDRLYDQSSTCGPEFISTMPTTCLRKFLKRSLPYAKTIKILRDLESIQIYAIL